MESNKESQAESQAPKTSHGNNGVPKDYVKYIEYKSRGRRVGQMSFDELRGFMLVCIAKIHAECGFRYQKDLVEATIESMCNDLIVDYGHLTTFEVYNAMVIGATGEYGQWAGLSNNTYRIWLRGYNTCPKRLAALAYNIRLLKAKDETLLISPPDNDSFMTKACLKAFDSYALEGKVDDIGNALFDFLWRKKVIRFTQERKDGFRELAREVIQQNIMRGITLGNTPIKERLKQLKANKDDDEVTVIAKKIALNTFFKELIDIGQQLKDIML